MEANTPMGVLRMGATSQAQIDTFSDDLIRSVKDGEANALEVLVQLKAFGKVTERVVKEIKENCMREAELHPETAFNLYGATISKGDTATEYDYSNDAEWVTLNAKTAEAKAKQTERETFLKAVKVSFQTIDESTGEMVTVRPPLKKSSAGLKISFK